MTSTLSISKLLKTNFRTKTPWRVEPDNQQEVLDQVQNHIQEWKRLHNNTNKNNDYHLQQRGKSLHVSINFNIGQSYSWHSNLNLIISFNTEHNLIIEYYNDTALLSNLDQLSSFLRNYKLALQQQQAQAVKLQKLRDLKIKAVVARVRQIAKEDGFDYAIDTSPLRIILYVRLDEKKCIKISIPFTQFQDIIPNLRTNIHLMRELNASGINFQTTQSHYAMRQQWVDHRTIEDN